MAKNEKKNSTPKLSALEQLAALKAQMAALEAQAKTEADENRKAIDAEIGELADTIGKHFPAEGGGVSWPALARAIRSYSEHGTAFPSGGASLNLGERKARVVLTDAQWIEAEAMLKDTSDANKGIIRRCRDVEIKYNVSFQTVYNRARALGLTNKRDAVASK